MEHGFQGWKLLSQYGDLLHAITIPVLYAGCQSLPEDHTKGTVRDWSEHLAPHVGQRSHPFVLVQWSASVWRQQQAGRIDVAGLDRFDVSL